MFGYVQPLKPELKIKEYACYRSYYCGVCKALGRYNAISRMTITYDAAFLAIVNSSVMEDVPQVRLERCIVNPFKPKPVIRDHSATDYAAAVNALLAYFKLIDSWKDDRNLLSLFGSGLIKPVISKIRNAYPDIYKSIEDHIRNLDCIEKEGVPSIDRASEPFARLMSEILPYPELDKTNRRVLSWMGYNLGKWIYVIDAYCDIDDDLKSKSYNVMVAKQKGSLSAEEIREKNRDEVEFVLKSCLSEIGKSYELLDIKKNSGLLENIIFLGLFDRTLKVLNDGGEKNGSIQGAGSKPKCHRRGNQGCLQETGEEISS